MAARRPTRSDKRAARRARRRLHDVVGRPQDRDEGQGHARVLGAQEEERVRGVAEREEADHGQQAAEPGRRGVAARASVVAGRGPRPAPRSLAHAEDEHDHAGQRG